MFPAVRASYYRRLLRRCFPGETDPVGRSQPESLFPRVSGFGKKTSVSTTNDRDLVEASLGGDVRAFAGLVERYRYAVFGLCLNCTRDLDAAEDAAQEAFIKAFLKLRTLEAIRRMHRSPKPDAMKKWIYFGGAKRWFDAALFDPVRDDPEFAALVQDGISG